MLSLFIYSGLTLLSLLVALILRQGLGGVDLSHLALAFLLLTFVNFIMAPMLARQLGKLTKGDLFFYSFLINFLLLNVSIGLISEFSYGGMGTALVIAIAQAGGQILVSVNDQERRKLMT